MAIALGRSRTTARVTAAIALIAAFVLVMVMIGGLLRGGGYAWAGCGEGPTNPSITVQTYPDSYKYPYGNVISCRELRRQGHMFGSTDLSIYLLLVTQQGLVAVRVDYQNLGQRRYTADAIELAADDVPSGLSDDELAHLSADISPRGGIRPGEWILHYGDG